MKGSAQRLIPKRKSLASTIKVFLVEDFGLLADSVRRVIEDTPEKDLELVGFCTKNTPDLPNLIEKSRADVVIIDMVLGVGSNPEEIKHRDKLEESGIEAIKAIRQKLGASIKIIAWSYFRYMFEKEAIKAGANCYRFRDLPNDEIRALIRKVYAGDISDSHSFGDILGLRLFVRSRAVVVIGNSSEKGRIHLDSQSFGFLYYLIMERKSKEKDWLERRECDIPDHHQVIYNIRKEDVWKKLNAAAGNQSYQNPIEGKVLSKYKTVINGRVKEYAGANVKELITGPDRGRTPGPTSYSLNPMIAAENIYILDT